MGAILFGVSMALHAMTGWSLSAIIIGAGVAVTLYTLLGGIEAVIWTDVIQSLVLLAGAMVIAVLLITGVTLGVLVICWMTFADAFPENLRSPFHANMITVIGTLTIFLVGLGVSQWRVTRNREQ